MIHINSIRNNRIQEDMRYVLEKFNRVANEMIFVIDTEEADDILFVETISKRFEETLYKLRDSLQDNIETIKDPEKVKEAREAIGIQWKYDER